MKDRYLKPKDVAEYLGISVGTARVIMPEMPGCIDVGGGGKNRALRVPESGIEAWKDSKIIFIHHSNGKLQRRKNGQYVTA